MDNQQEQVLDSSREQKHAGFTGGLNWVSIPGLVTPVSGPSETSIPGNRKP